MIHSYKHYTMTVKQNIAACNNMNKSHKHNIKWKNQHYMIPLCCPQSGRMKVWCLCKGRGELWIGRWWGRSFWDVVYVLAHMSVMTVGSLYKNTSSYVPMIHILFNVIVILQNLTLQYSITSQIYVIFQDY